MKRWLVLGLLGLAVAWGPYVYSELVSSPVRAHGKARHAFRFLGGDDEAAAGTAAEAEPDKPEAQGDDKPADPKPTAADQKPTDKTAVTAAKPSDQPGPANPAAKPAAEGDPAAPDEAERPTLPAELLPSFRKTFDVEPRDAFWANDEEPKLRSLFKDAGGAPDGLTEVACRTSVCRFVFTPDDLDADALTKLYTSLRTRYADTLALETKPGSVGEHATLYMLRAGYKL